MKDKRQKWYFTFGSGQAHSGCYISFFGTQDETRKKMFNAFGKKWSMQYNEDQWNTPSKESISFNGLDPKTKPTLAEVWNWKEIK
jgi:hypothetical protein